MAKKRLDLALVERGLFETRSKAQAAIMAGKVRLHGNDHPKAGTPVGDDAKIEILEDAIPYVSRGGLKLEGALDAFKIDVSGRTAIDVGASTGGFTDCLLQRGAAKVYAVDVGRDQLAQTLREDPRVVSMEQLHARDLNPDSFPQASLAVVDVSFISLAKVLEPIVRALTPPARLICLVKPQFELEPKKVPKGVVRDPAHRREAVDRVRAKAAELGLEEAGLIDSPVKGPKGNLEWLIYWRLGN